MVAPSQSPGGIGANVKRRREAIGISQAELARRAKIDRAYVYRIEEGFYASPRMPTLGKLARALECEIEELTGRENIRRVSPYESNPKYRAMIDALEAVEIEDRDEILRHAMWSASRARTIPANVLTFPRAPDSDDFPLPPIPLEEWKLGDTDLPRPLHAQTKPIAASVAAGRPSNPDDDTLIPAAQLLNSIREIRDPRVNVIRVAGHSMHPTLRDGWLILIDPSRELFRPGRIVMVYLKDEGTTLGKYVEDGERRWLEKRNPNYGGPIEIPLPHGEWYPVGTVTRIVDASVDESDAAPSVFANEAASLVGHLREDDARTALLFLRNFASAEQITSRNLREQADAEREEATAKIITGPHASNSDRGDRRPPRDDHPGRARRTPVRSDPDKRGG